MPTELLRTAILKVCPMLVRLFAIITRARVFRESPPTIYIGNGVSELVLMALLPLLNKGDEVLMPSPSYSLWSNSTYIAGGQPVFYRCNEENNWYPDIDDMRSKVTSKTKAIVIINPNNPTGAVYPKEVLEDIIQVARENDLLIFSDEIYDRLVMDGVEHYSTAALAPDRMVITMNGLSKSHIVCGFRCGWMCISGYKGKADDYVEGIFQIAAMRLCGNALTQLVIPAAHSMFSRSSTSRSSTSPTTRNLLLTSFTRNIYSSFPDRALTGMNPITSELLCFRSLTRSHRRCVTSVTSSTAIGRRMIDN